MLLLAMGCMVLPVQAPAQPDVVLQPVMTIGRSNDNLLLGAFGVAGLRGRRIVVSDKLEHKVKIFDRTGRLVGMTGRRGKNRGAFWGPGPLAARDSIIAVGDFESARVQVFTEAGTAVSEFHMDTPVFDLAFDPSGSLWVGTLPNARGETLFQCSIHGKVLKKLALAFPARNGFDYVFTMAIEHDGTITVAYMTHNTVEVWDTAGRFLGNCQIPGIRSRAVEKILMPEGSARGIAVPEDNVFLRVTADASGNRYLLADQYTEHPARDVYVIDRRGKLLSRLVLPEQSYGVYLDAGGSLYSIERSRMLIRVYNLER
jgi:hypothetical protein